MSARNLEKGSGGTLDSLKDVLKLAKNRYRCPPPPSLFRPALMYSNSPSLYTCNLPTRALVPQRASTSKHRFLVGTCSLHDDNELTVLEYAESNSLEAVATYVYRDQIWCMDSSPSEPDLVVISSVAINGGKAVSLSRMPHQTTENIEGSKGNNDDKEKLIELCPLKLYDNNTTIHCIKWQPSNNENILMMDSRTVSLWNVSGSTVSLTNKVMLTEKSAPAFHGSVAWDPHSTLACAAAVGSDLQFLDLRTCSTSSSISNAHDGPIRDVDYNPNKSLTVVSCGDDRKVKFWDIRNLSAPVKILAGHSHWVWSARYNPFHDQLLLSCGSDNMVNLWRVASCSSAPWLTNEESSSPTDHARGASSADGSDPPDVKIRALDGHEDSVHAVAWSAADAWVYCSLSYDGRVLLNHVPSTEKYKILL